MAAAPAAAEPRVIARRAAWALAAREMRRVLGLWTQTVLPPVVTGVIFLAIFGGVLSDRMPAVSGVAYVRFILPGLLVMTVAGQAFANNSTSLVQARTRATSRTC
jgi:ABC-2 type transport system permease protein